MVETRLQSQNRSSLADGKLPRPPSEPNTVKGTPLRRASLAAAALSLLSCEGARHHNIPVRPFGAESSFGDILSDPGSSQGAGVTTSGTQDPLPSGSLPPANDWQRSSPANPVLDLFTEKQGPPEDFNRMAFRFTAETLPQVPEYRDEYRNAPVRPHPSRSEDAFDALTGIFYDRDRLSTLAAKHGARLLRRYQMPQEGGEEVTNGYDSIMSRARLRLFSRDSPLGPLRTDIRPRHFDGVDNFDVRFKIQWVLEEPDQFSRIFNSVGCTVDSGWEDGTLFMVYQEVRF